MHWIQILIISILSILLFIVYRLMYLYKILYEVKKSSKKQTPNLRTIPVNTMICLGSGGHTKEMMIILKELDPRKYDPRTYIVADSDTTSQSKVVEIESEYKKVTGLKLDYHNVVKISRSRHVNQSYFTSIFTTLRSVVECIPLIYHHRPELILCNGPGTCIPVCIITFLMKIFFVHTKCKIVFVESFCRVKTLSLSGKILVEFADVFVVNWPKLQGISPRIEYFGRLM